MASILLAKPVEGKTHLLFRNFSHDVPGKKIFLTLFYSTDGKTTAGGTPRPFVRDIRNRGKEGKLGYMPEYDLFVKGIAGDEPTDVEIYTWLAENERACFGTVV